MSSRTRAGPLLALALALTLTLGSSASVSLATGEPQSRSTTVAVKPDSFSTFETRTLPRTAFPLSGNSRAALLRHAAVSPEGTRHQPYAPAGTRSLGIVTWDRALAELSQIRSFSRGGPSTLEGLYRVQAAGMVPWGRAQGEARIGQSAGRLYLAWGSVQLETFRALSATLGDASAPEGQPGLEGLTLRGFKLEQDISTVGICDQTKAGLFIGHAPVQYANMEAGTFPRALQGAFVQMGHSDSSRVRGQLFSMSDHGTAGISSPDRIRSGGGYGVAGALRRSVFNVLGSLYKSRFQFGDGTAEGGSDLRINAEGDRGPIHLAGTWEAEHGAAYVGGPFGALQPVPSRILQGNAAVHLGRCSAGAWIGEWAEPAGRIGLLTDSGQPAQDPAMQSNLSSRSRQWGMRTAFSVPHYGTGFSLSGESRTRTVSSGDQDIVTLAAAVSQTWSSRTSLTLRWNDMRYRHRPAAHYLSGNASLRIFKHSLLTFQQQTEWQEPIGPRLVSMAELSSVRILQGRGSLSARLTQAYDQQDGRFHPSETALQISGHVSLRKGIVLAPRYRIERNGTGTVHEIALGFTRTFDQSEGGLTTAVVDGNQVTRQILEGVVFEDADGNGTRDPGDPGIPGVQVVIDGDLRDPVACDLDGGFRVLIRPGRHVVQLLAESIPTEFTTDVLGPFEVEVRVDRTAEVSFAIQRKTGSIEGQVLDASSAREPGRPDSLLLRTGTVGVKVVLNGGEFTYTDSAGRFHFRNLPAGTYEVALDPRSLPFGFRPEGDAVLRLRVASGSDTVTPCEFRISRPVRQSQF